MKENTIQDRRWQVIVDQYRPSNVASMVRLFQNKVILLLENFIRRAENFEEAHVHKGKKERIHFSPSRVSRKVQLFIITVSASYPL